MSENKPQDSFKDRKNIWWVVLSGAMALTFLVLLFLPDSGTGSATASVYAAMLWCGLFGAAIARYIGKSGWIGFAVGSGIGMLLQITAQIIVYGG
jgi:VIT1/CCC1 family predicted Fe2+/Mn2+ transporter